MEELEESEERRGSHALRRRREDHLYCLIDRVQLGFGVLGRPDKAKTEVCDHHTGNEGGDFLIDV